MRNKFIQNFNILFFISSWFLFAEFLWADWGIQTVDSAWGFTSIELDASGNPHISYFDGTNKDLKYARWTNNPTLSWTGETNYTSDGLYPETGDTSATFIYRVKYTDADNDAPASGYPKVHIKKGGSEISGSPFTMSYVSGNYNTGAIYTYSTTFSYGSAYTYYFEAYDAWNASATGELTTEKPGPAVISKIPEINQVKVYHGIFKTTQNERCYISFNLSQPGKTTVKVFNSENTESTVLLDAYCNTGIQTIIWDGKNNNNEPLASGVYIIRIEAPGIKQTKKVVIVR